MVRLVKGAYWDTEIKLAQVLGLDDYPVFTRKPATDVSYIACAQALLAARRADLPAVRHPQQPHGGHGPRVRGGAPRLRVPEAARHGRRAVRRARARDRRRRAACTRRSGAIAISSRISCAGCSRTARTAPSCTRSATRTRRSSAWWRIRSRRCRGRTRRIRVCRSRALLLPDRLNSRGVDLSDREVLGRLTRRIDADRAAATATPGARAITEPADRRRLVGAARDANGGELDEAVRSAAAAWRRWDETPAEERARALERTADLHGGGDRRADLALRARSGEDAARRGGGGSRGGRLLPLLRRARPRGLRRRPRPPRADGRGQLARARRPRRVRLHQPVEFPARDLHRPGERGARWQATR